MFKQRILLPKETALRVIKGTDEHAFQFARVHTRISITRNLQRVEAHSIAKVDLKIPNARDDRITYQLHKRLAAIRSRGYVSEIQIRDHRGCLERVVLMNADGDRFD